MSTARAPRALPGSWTRLGRDLERSQKALRIVRRRIAKTPQLDPVASADIAELHHVDDETMPGIRRIGTVAHPKYIDPRGRNISSPAVLQRINALVIPPAWTDVWICPDPSGHIQATGRDARGRKQYRYHPQWTAVRDEVKYGRLLAFAAALPKIRARTAADLRRPRLPREKVLAAVVQLLEKTLIRVGNEEYARSNHSFGLTTMRASHASIHGTVVHFEFRGKSGVAHAIDLHDARLATIIKACRHLPGHELFQYVDAAGKRVDVGSADVNAYLREITGQPFTSKDFRTWGGTVLAARALAQSAAAGGSSKRRIIDAIKKVSQRLGNTVAVCRRCYIHPAVLAAAARGSMIEIRPASAAAATSTRLSPDEKAVVALIRRHATMSPLED
jgi:DNA topoisomerase I